MPLASSSSISVDLFCFSSLSPPAHDCLSGTGIVEANEKEKETEEVMEVDEESSKETESKETENVQEIPDEDKMDEN